MAQSAVRRKKEKGKSGMESAGKPRDIRERTFEFAVRIVKLCQRLNEEPGVSRTLGNQLLRSGTSVGANLEEAYAGQSKADFISKNAIALKEARETVYWLRLLAATDVFPASGLKALQTEAEELTRIIAAIIVKSKK
ncbi:four helix bundle protein [Leptolyngbyaceae cyanobacterium UHCC 1019]